MKIIFELENPHAQILWEEPLKVVVSCFQGKNLLWILHLDKLNLKNLNLFMNASKRNMPCFITPQDNYKLAFNGKDYFITSFVFDFLFQRSDLEKLLNFLLQEVKK